MKPVEQYRNFHRVESAPWEIRAVCECCGWESSWYPANDATPADLALDHADLAGHRVVYGTIGVNGELVPVFVGNVGARGVGVRIDGDFQPIYTGRATHRRLEGYLQHPRRRRYVRSYVRNGIVEPGLGHNTN
jgi:hypothetical protein